LQEIIEIAKDNKLVYDDIDEAKKNFLSFVTIILSENISSLEIKYINDEPIHAPIIQLCIENKLTIDYKILLASIETNINMIISNILVAIETGYLIYLNREYKNLFYWLENSICLLSMFKSNNSVKTEKDEYIVLKGTEVKRIETIDDREEEFYILKLHFQKIYNDIVKIFTKKMENLVMEIFEEVFHEKVILLVEDFVGLFKKNYAKDTLIQSFLSQALIIIDSLIVNHLFTCDPLLVDNIINFKMNITQIQNYFENILTDFKKESLADFKLCKEVCNLLLMDINSVM
jgi:hypothetical protein